MAELASGKSEYITIYIQYSICMRNYATQNYYTVYQYSDCVLALTQKCISQYYANLVSHPRSARGVDVDTKHQQLKKSSNNRHWQLVVSSSAIVLLWVREETTGDFPRRPEKISRKEFVSCKADTVRFVFHFLFCPLTTTMPYLLLQFYF